MIWEGDEPEFAKGDAPKVIKVIPILDREDLEGIVELERTENIERANELIEEGWVVLKAYVYEVVPDVTPQEVYILGKPGPDGYLRQ